IACGGIVPEPGAACGQSLRLIQFAAAVKMPRGFSANSFNYCIYNRCNFNYYARIVPLAGLGYGGGRNRSVRDQNQGEDRKMAPYVLAHGAWHTGAELEPTAAPIRAAGNEVHTPTIAGNRPGDAKTVGLPEAIKSIVDYLVSKDLKDVILLGHSYGGMIITGVA